MFYFNMCYIGNFGFPEMGCGGAALASSLSLYFGRIDVFLFYDRSILIKPRYSYRLVWR